MEKRGIWFKKSFLNAQKNRMIEGSTPLVRKHFDWKRISANPSPNPNSDSDTVPWTQTLTLTLTITLTLSPTLTHNNIFGLTKWRHVARMYPDTIIGWCLDSKTFCLCYRYGIVAVGLVLLVVIFAYLLVAKRN